MSKYILIIGNYQFRSTAVLLRICPCRPQMAVYSTKQVSLYSTIQKNFLRYAITVL